MKLETLRDSSALSALYQASQQQPVLLFKHSSRCPISSAAHRQVRQLANALAGSHPIRMLVVQQQPELSRQVTDDLAVRHETPQAIVVWQGEAVQVLNHQQVRADALATLLRHA